MHPIDLNPDCFNLVNIRGGGQLVKKGQSPYPARLFDPPVGSGGGKTG